MLVDQGSAFGPLFINIDALSNVEVDRTGIETHSSLRLGERYHQPLRKTYRKITAGHPTADVETSLALSVKAMNGNLGAGGLVPSALGFGEFPEVYTKLKSPDERAFLASRAKMAHTARSQMAKHMAELQVKWALKHSTPTASDPLHKAGDPVLVWREKPVNNYIGEWIGPFSVLVADETKKIVFVQDFRMGAARPFNIELVKHYYNPETWANSFFADLQRRLSFFR